ncbi:MAG: hypothetical protein Q8N23_13635 [Archangium sp.]|nr:hypothetical protein [Archangium sp.]MDP3153714.1 hypothetical protein [Archangium sp.]MDP3569237.1 hypothetical protein [Archangium sp.]
MKIVILSVLALCWSPAAQHEVAPATDEPNASYEAQVIGKEDATQCKRKCNSRCNGAQNKSKCVAECRRACDR